MTRALTAALLIASSGCVRSAELDGPIIDSIAPPSGSSANPTPVVVAGRHFFVRADTSPDATVTAVSTTFVVTVGGIDADDVVHHGSETLSAIVPAGLTPGAHTVRVVTPMGAAAELVDGFWVSTPGSDGSPSDGDGGDPHRGDRLTADARGDVDPGPPSGSPIELTSDPFGDGTRFAFVFGYASRIWLGPRADGTGALSMLPDGSDPRVEQFVFAQDTTGNAGRNSQSGPFPSIGATGCIADTYDCGPDNEDGRGQFRAVDVGGETWLVAAGARSGKDFDYIYMTRDVSSPLFFSYVDLSQLLGGNTESVAALHGFGDRLYVGFPDSGGNRPYLLSLLSTPSGVGLDAEENGTCLAGALDVCDLSIKDLPPLAGSAALSMIDAVTDFNDRLYVANNGGVLRSVVATPNTAKDNPEDWLDITPSAPDYGAATSVALAAAADITPRQRAVVAFATFAGRLFFGRNTQAGPQLWACDPAVVSGPPPASPSDCDAGDWRLIAPNAAANPALTQFDNPDNSHVTLVLSTGSHLYVGFDNAVTGVVLFRAASPGLLSAADFAGAGGCSASLHPAACPGLGTNGLASPPATRILDGFYLSGSTDWVYLTAGDGTTGVRVFRIRD